jgi:CubicO group peptidase (beta-lactamase class C family)
MKKLITLILFLLVGKQIVFSQEINQKLLEQIVERAKVCHSDALIIYHKNKVISHHYFGKNYRDSLIETMSCTKSIVGIAAMCMIEDGLLDSLQVPVYQYYPEWNQGKKKLITIEHILSMTTGLQNKRNAKEEIYPSPDFVKLALAAELSEEPGTKFRYNNKSLNLISGIFLKVTGKTMDKYIEERLFKPLNIKKYKWEKDAAGNPHAMSGLQLKPDDFVKFGLLILNKGKFEGQQVIQEENINRMLQAIPQSAEYSYLWWLDYDISLTIDESVIERLKKENADSDFIAFMKTIKGVYDNPMTIKSKLFQKYGKNVMAIIKKNVGSPWKLYDVKFKGGIRGYRADGYLGNYIVVLPKENIVAIRMISSDSFDFNDKKGKDNFPEFIPMIKKLVNR